MAYKAPKSEFEIYDRTISIFPSMSSIVGISFPCDKGDVLIPKLLSNSDNFNKFIDIESRTNYQREGLRLVLKDSAVLFVRPLMTDDLTAGCVLDGDGVADDGGVAISAAQAEDLNYMYATEYERIPTADEVGAANVFTFGGVTEYAVLMARNPGSWGNDLSYKIENSDAVNLTFDLLIYDDGVLVETWEGISTDVNATNEYNQNIFITDFLERESDYVRAYVNPSATAVVPDDEGVAVSLAEGADYSSVTDADIVTAYAKFRDTEIAFGYLITAGNSDATTKTTEFIALLTELYTICTQKILCQAVADSPLVNDYSDIVTFYTTVRATVTSDNGSYISPVAPYQKGIHSIYGNVLNIPASFFAIRCYLKRDAKFTYPWHTPAGIRDGIGYIEDSLGNTIDLEAQTTRDVLWDVDVNCIHRFGSQLYLDGDKNMYGSESYFNAVGVRGLLNWLQYSLQYVGEYIKYLIIDLREDESNMRNKIYDLAKPVLDIPLSDEERAISEYEIIANATNNPTSKIDQHIAIVAYKFKPNPNARYVVQRLIVMKQSSELSTTIV